MRASAHASDAMTVLSQERKRILVDFEIAEDEEAHFDEGKFDTSPI